VIVNPRETKERKYQTIFSNNWLRWQSQKENKEDFQNLKDF